MQECLNVCIVQSYNNVLIYNSAFFYSRIEAFSKGVLWTIIEAFILVVVISYFFVFH